MSSSLKIDTLKFAKRLTEAGLDQRAAEAIVEGLAEADTSELATKSDVSALRADLAEQKAEIFSRLWVMAIGIVGLTVALMKILP